MMHLLFKLAEINYVSSILIASQTRVLRPNNLIYHNTLQFSFREHANQIRKKTFTHAYSQEHFRTYSAIKVKDACTLRHFI